MLGPPYIAYRNCASEDAFEGQCGSLKAQLPWKQQPEIYDKLAGIMVDTRPWSFLRPFDDLDGEET